ncbi:Putative MetA-pathway of phenol degradation [Flavobacteriaceae bacterium MAR_2010_188]|nr:Putative MetA-pathway of phenol degradation [Flavobacteriaceae bacterium MAR_2010_188]
MNKITLLVLIICGSFQFGFTQKITITDTIVGAQNLKSYTAENVLITDRPDATESPSTIPQGFVQIETGALYESYEENSIKLEAFTYNTTLVRIGILNNLEMRIGWDFVEGRTTLDNTRLTNVSSGFNPLLFGAKIAIAQEDGWFPEIGFLGHLYLPFTASKDYRPETTGVDFRFSFAHTLTENSSIAYNIGAQWGDDNPEAAYIYTLSYAYSISKRFGAYAEVYGDLPENSKSNHYWDAGLTYLIKNNLQLDATVGRSFTEGQDLLLSAGFSLRLPK